MHNIVDIFSYINRPIQNFYPGHASVHTPSKPYYLPSELLFVGLHTVDTNAFSVRVVSWVTLLFGLCISTSYSAVLFSRLTVDKSDLVIPSLDSVSKMRTHVLCVRRNSFGYLLFKVTNYINVLYIIIIILRVRLRIRFSRGLISVTKVKFKKKMKI